MVKAIRWPFAVVLSALLLTACAGAEPTRTPTTTQIEVTQTTPDTEATVAAAVEATIAARLKINFTPEPGGFWDANLDPPPGPDGKYPAGAEAKIRALLHLAHSSFVRWEGDASGTFPETSVIVDRDLQIHAVFLHVGTATPAPPTHPPTRQSIITQVPSVSCTPPPCRLGAGEVYYCAGVCPGGCGTTCATITPMPTPAPQPAVELGLFSEGVRILALGDSYTIGHNVGALERWPVQLAQRLREEGFQIDEPEIVARTGWTTQELTVAIEDAILEGPYQLVTLLIGVNNQ